MLTKKITAVMLSLVMLLFSSCANSKENNLASSSSSNTGITFKDDLNRTIELSSKPSRVVSLFGSYAETWLLAGGTLAGVTEDAKTERKLDLSDDVKVIGTVKDPNIEELLALSPDFVLLSADLDSHKKVSETLEKANIKHAFFKVEHFNDYLNMLNICTDITGKKDLYKQNGTNIQIKIDDILNKIKSNEQKPKILFIRAMSTAAKAKTNDNMTGMMLEELNTENIASKYPSLLEDLSMETIIQEDPDFIFVTTMGNSQKALEALKSGIQSNPAWASLKAVKNDHYIVLPKDLFHYKPNAKWGESYEYLAKILYPEIFK